MFDLTFVQFVNKNKEIHFFCESKLKFLAFDQLKMSVDKAMINEEEAGDEDAPMLRFSESEKILCFHGPLIYEAKINKAEVKNGTAKYFIHYQGWNRKWDEWVSKPFLNRI